MAGCYGNDPFDRYWEGQLNKHLEEQDEEREECWFCGEECDQYKNFCSKECAKAWIED